MGALLYRDLIDAVLPVTSTRILRTSLAALSASFATAVLLTGCGAQYRPVVSAINPVGPAGQPTKYAVAISNPGANQLGLVTVVDFSGDTVVATPQIQTNPSYFQLNTSGTEGYTINAQGSFDFFATNPAGLITSTVGQTTLPATSQPVSISAFTPLSTTASVFVPEVATSNIAALNASTAALYDSVTVGANPVYVVGYDGTPRVYAISQGATPGTSNGTIAALETTTTSSLSVSATINVGVLPVYGVMTADTRRAFILNQGSGTVSVVNVVNNALDSTTPTITIPTIAYSGGTVAPRPIWAGLSPTTSELIVLNQGDGTHNGSLSIISIPLCNLTATTSNPNCNVLNPVDAAGFGTIVSTVAVGVNPVMVSVQQDGSAAYVANAGNATTAGSVTVVNLVSGTVTATIAGAPDTTCLTTATTSVCGHPNTISATTGAPTGKVYVTSPDSKNLTVIYTDTNTVQNHIALQGTGLRVLVTAP
jgi:DNA-binding beta-propeller fold protein YncE